MQHNGWGYDGETAVRIKDLETHACSDEELGLSEDSEYKLAENSVGVITTWKKKFKCLNTEDIEIWGDFNSEAA